MFVHSPVDNCSSPFNLTILSLDSSCAEVIITLNMLTVNFLQTLGWKATFNLFLPRTNAIYRPMLTVTSPRRRHAVYQASLWRQHTRIAPQMQIAKKCLSTNCPPPLNTLRTRWRISQSTQTSVNATPLALFLMKRICLRPRLAFTVIIKVIQPRPVTLNRQSLSCNPPLTVTSATICARNVIRNCTTILKYIHWRRKEKVEISFCTL